MKLSHLNEYAAARPSEVPKSVISNYHRSGLATALPKYAPDEEEDDSDDEDESDVE